MCKFFRGHSSSRQVAALLFQTSVLTKIKYCIFLICQSLPPEHRELFCLSSSSHPFFLTSRHMLLVIECSCSPLCPFLRFWRKSYLEKWLCLQQGSRTRGNTDWKGNICKGQVPADLLKSLQSIWDEWCHSIIPTTCILDSKQTAGISFKEFHKWDNLLVSWMEVANYFCSEIRTQKRTSVGIYRHFIYYLFTQLHS